MKKLKQLIVLMFFIIISILYNQRSNHDFEIIEEANSQIEVTIEGAVENEKQIIYLEDIATIQEALTYVTLKEDAATECINMNKELYHGDYFYIPYRSEIIAFLNSSDLEELTLINGIGPTTAERIIDYRNQQDFTAIEDIMNIAGIKEKKYVKYRRYLCL